MLELGAATEQQFLVSHPMRSCSDRPVVPESTSEIIYGGTWKHLESVRQNHNDLIKRCPSALAFATGNVSSFIRCTPSGTHLCTLTSQM